uniref:C-type lectin domain-containing protein n=1 Tax=Sinocyclocheilus rhinocerous TaxID=307959 RepID=A0A673LXN0_9TELE
MRKWLQISTSRLHYKRAARCTVDRNCVASSLKFIIYIFLKYCQCLKHSTLARSPRDADKNHCILLAGLLSLTLCKPQEYILYKQIKTWENAQSYCRTHHYDLATVQTDEDWTSLKEAADEQQFSSFAWIGLFNDINGWRWSYNEESLVFKSWGLVQPDNYGAGEECVTIAFDGKWFDFYCTSEIYFVCYDGEKHAQSFFTDAHELSV